MALVGLGSFGVVVMNIVQVPRRFVRDEWGGTETVILETSRELLRLGHDTEILCPNALASTDSESINGVQVTRVPYFYPYLGLRHGAKRQLDKKGGNLFSFSLMRELGQRSDVDLVHLHTQKRVGGIVRHVCRRHGIPYVVSLHGGLLDMPAEEEASFVEPTSGALEWGKALGWWVGSRRVLDDAAAIICVGAEEARRVAERFPQKRVVNLPNGVDPDRFAVGDGSRFRRQHSISDDAFVALSMGRIDPQKNQLFLIDQLTEMRRRCPAVHLVLIGALTNESYARKVEAAIDEAGLGEHVTLIPGLDAADRSLVDAYHAADLFVLPSIHEPFGIVILEAWSAGLPVLASRVGGIPSFVEHERGGVLFESNDANGFIAAFERLATHPEERTALAEAGQRKARVEFSWTSVTESLIDLYEEVRCETAVCQ